MRYSSDGSLDIETEDICYSCRYAGLGCPLVEMITDGLAILAVPKGESITKFDCVLFRKGLKVVPST